MTWGSPACRSDEFQWLIDQSANSVEPDRRCRACETSWWAALLSLDGVAENPNRFFIEWDDVMDASITIKSSTQNAVILGAVAGNFAP